jgi:ABC-type transporter Mla subunit MlaD
MSDRNLGYSVIFFCVVFVLIISLYLAFQFLAPHYYRTVIFNSINTLSFLKKQDPISIRGMEMGQIRNIFWKNGNTYVEIQTRHPLTIHQGYRIIAEAKGFMGDRYLEINPGDMNAPLIAEKEPLSGFFPIGPTEAIALSAGMDQRVRSLIVLTDELRTGPFTSRFNFLTKKFDSISVLLSQILHNVDHLGGKNVDTLAVALQKADDYSKKLNSSVPKAMATIEGVMAKTKKLLVAADSLSISVVPLIERIKGREASVLDNDFHKLQKQVESLRNLINELQEDGLKLPINL